MDKYEVIEKLRLLDEVLLVELLAVTSEDIVDAFLDVIDERYNYIVKQLQDTEVF